MTRIDKRISRIMQRPIRSDIAFDDVVNVLQHMGFEIINIDGSHYIFRNKKYREIELRSIPKPHGNNKYVKPPYIKLIQNAITAYERKENEGLQDE